MAKKRANLTFYQPVPKGRQRFRELIIYIASRYKEAEYFGATKLNKTLYHADFRAYERFGVSLTGMTYFALKQGPAPQALVPVRNDLISEGAISIEEREVGNMRQKRVIPKRAAFLDLFTRDEIALVDQVIEELWNQTAEEVSNASHDIRWRTLKLKDRIPYEATFISNDALTDNDLARTKELANKHGWR